jgi:hypothetical protein
MRVTYPRRGACLSYPGAYELPAPPKHVPHLSGPACLDLTVDDRCAQAHFVRVRPISDRGPPRRRRRVEGRTRTVRRDEVEEMAARLYWAVEQQWIRNARTNTDKPNKSSQTDPRRGGATLL